MTIDLEVIFGGLFGQIAAIDKQALVGAGIVAQKVDNGFLPGQTARLFLVSAAEFDIAGERAYIDQAKIRGLRLTGGRAGKAKRKI
ncbi:MAG: hypothetical protein JXR80_01635 [Deltaproteobacteria bacterium]|nr:hypothetical protein [Deltaproteobacteria bacterium]